MQLLLTSEPAVAISALRTRITAELEASKQVLWVVSGGSNITASIAVMAGLPVPLRRQLTLLLSDERYGEVGHTDSNYQQFMQQGFGSQDARFIPTLRPGLSLESTVAAYAETTQVEFAKADIIISQLGIGTDGHIAGALPGSPAISSQEWVVGYDSPPYKRITMTFPALRHINADYSLVYGSNKRPALERLAQLELEPGEQPAQILKQLPEAYVYNDQLGDPL